MAGFDLWRYRRVSTDNKGQDPRRQEISTDAWAAREGARIVGDTLELPGTSATFTNPLDRPRFIEACEAARAAGCRGLLAEDVDRVCGQGSDELGWTRVEVRRRYGLELFFASVPVALHGTIGGNVQATASAEVRRERIATDRRRIREGIENRRKTCAKCGAKKPWPATCPRSSGPCIPRPVGGETQRKVTPELAALVAEVARANPGWGLRRIAAEVSARRGAALPSLTAGERRRRAVTHETVRAALEVARLSNGEDRQTERESRGADSRQPETSPIDTKESGWR